MGSERKDCALSKTKNKKPQTYKSFFFFSGENKYMTFILFQISSDLLGGIYLVVDHVIIKKLIKIKIYL